MATSNKLNRSSVQKTGKTKKAASASLTKRTNTQQPEINDILANLDSTPSSTEEITMNAETEAPALEEQPSEDFPSFWGAVKNSPHFISMLIGLACSFLVSASFYWAGKNMMKIKFEDMFLEKLPRYKNLVYGIGDVQNIDVDRVILRDDLHDQYFATDEENNSITLDINKIIDQYQKTQPIMNNQDLIVPKKVMKDKLKNTTPQMPSVQDDLFLTNTTQPAVTVNASAYEVTPSASE